MQNVSEKFNVTVQQWPWRLLEVTAICPGLIYACGDAQIYKKLSPELPFEGTREHPALFWRYFLTYSTDAAKGETRSVAEVPGAEITILYGTVYWCL